MPEAQPEEVTGMEGRKATNSMPFMLLIAILASVVGPLWMLAVILFGFYGAMLTAPVCTGLLGGFVVGLIGLRERSRYSRLQRRLHSMALVVLASMALFLIPGMGIMRLLDLHCRLRVAVTGGQSELQSWAVDLLAQPRDDINVRDHRKWEVPESLWSKQVARLKPNHIFIDRIFQDGQEGVTLMYGGGFLGHWYIVLGPPGSKPNPNLTTERNSPWFPWSDGLYCRFTD